MRSVQKSLPWAMPAVTTRCFGRRVQNKKRKEQFRNPRVLFPVVMVTFPRMPACNLTHHLLSPSPIIAASSLVQVLDFKKLTEIMVLVLVPKWIWSILAPRQTSCRIRSDPSNPEATNMAFLRATADHNLRSHLHQPVLPALV
ncbi:hypothetical protein D9757_012127 [Collybiopsis confluens]|uniref:Uncharacterized protein n=1 Tax=Collybiopsis confluens TaxID=2823264 RepID=A0A8H5GIH8_9AGAR|nr:hypothetical protein D9757_012127 [Collybiopsis confluens]